MAYPQGVLFYDPLSKPLSAAGLPMANCYRLFYLTGTTTLANVYADAALTTPLSQVPGQVQPSCTADGSGRFNAIYLDPKVIYRTQLFTSTNIMLQDVDPDVPAPTPGIFAVVKPAGTLRANQAAPSNDPDLQITVPGPGNYLYEAYLQIVTAGASGASPGFTGGVDYTGGIVAGSTQINLTVGAMNASALANQGVLNVNTAYSLLTGGGPPGASNLLIIRGILNASSGGLLTVQWSQQTSNASGVTVSQGSYLTVQRIA